MCGHAMVSPNLLLHMASEIDKGKITCEKAAKELSRMWDCGIFNAYRAEKLLRRITSKEWTIWRFSPLHGPKNIVMNFPGKKIPHSAKGILGKEVMLVERRRSGAMDNFHRKKGFKRPQNYPLDWQKILYCFLTVPFKLPECPVLNLKPAQIVQFWFLNDKSK